MGAADVGELADRVDGARAHAAGGAHHQHRPVPARQVLGNLRPQRVRPQALRGVGGDPPDRVGAQAEEVARLLDPGVGAGGGVHPERRPRPAAARPRGPDLVAQHGPAPGQEADEVGHVAAAHQQPAAGLGIAHQLGHPAHRLRLDLGRHRRELPPADVRVHGRGEQVGQRAERRGGRRDVAHEAGVGVEQRVLEQQAGGLGEEVRRRRAARPGAAHGRAGHGSRRASRPRSAGRSRMLGEELGHPVHQLVAEPAELVRRELERYQSLRQSFSSSRSAPAGSSRARRGAPHARRTSRSARRP